MIENSLIAGVQAIVSGTPSQIGIKASGAGLGTSTTEMQTGDGFWQRFEDSAAALEFVRGGSNRPSVVCEPLRGGASLTATTFTPNSKSLVTLEGQKPTNQVSEGADRLPTAIASMSARTTDLKASQTLVAASDEDANRTGLHKNGQVVIQPSSSENEVPASLRHSLELGREIKNTTALQLSEGKTSEPSAASPLGSEVADSKPQLKSPVESLIGRDPNVAESTDRQTFPGRAGEVLNSTSLGSQLPPIRGKSTPVAVGRLQSAALVVASVTTGGQPVSSNKSLGDSPHGLSAQAPYHPASTAADSGHWNAVGLSNAVIDAKSLVVSSGVLDPTQVAGPTGPRGSSALVTRGANRNETVVGNVSTITEGESTVKGSGSTTGASQDWTVNGSLQGEQTTPFLKAVNGVDALPSREQGSVRDLGATAKVDVALPVAKSEENAWKTSLEGIAGLQSASVAESATKDGPAPFTQEIAGSAAVRTPKSIRRSESQGVGSPMAGLESAPTDGVSSDGSVGLEAKPLAEQTLSHSSFLVDRFQEQFLDSTGESSAGMVSVGITTSVKTAPSGSSTRDQPMTREVTANGVGSERAIDAFGKLADVGEAGTQPAGTTHNVETMPSALGASSPSFVHPPAAINLRASDSSIPQQSGRAPAPGISDQSIAMAEAGGFHHTTLAATPNVLEVGVASGTNGWLKVRAEMDGTGGVSASVVATTASAVEALHKELPALSAYLKAESVGVSSLVVNRAEAGGMTQNAASGSGLGNFGPGGFGAGSDSKGRQGEVQAQPVDSLVPESVEQRLRNVPFDTSGEVSSTAGYGAGSGGWLNVVA